MGYKRNQNQYIPQYFGGHVKREEHVHLKRISGEPRHDLLLPWIATQIMHELCMVQVK